MDTPMVCFESFHAESGGKVLHSAVPLSGTHDFVLPPLCLLEVVSVQEG
jgi:hypothetical protein